MSMGRPTKMEETTMARVVSALAAGNTRTAAARIAGIHPSTFRTWQARGEAGDEPYAAFASRVIEAEGKAECEAVRAVVDAARAGSWQAAAWWLERRRPQRWARREAPEPKKTATAFTTATEALAWIDANRPMLVARADRERVLTSNGKRTHDA
jgi:hypothetical protein